MIMNTLKCLALSGLSVALFVACAGCGKTGAGAQAQAFDQAPAAIKADWDTAVAADKTNDYYTASTSYAKVLAQEGQLTPKQVEVLESASRELSQRMVAAANNGDDAAKLALAKLMQEQNRH